MKKKIALLIILSIIIYNVYNYFANNEINKKLILINLIALIIYMFPLLNNKLKQ